MTTFLDRTDAGLRLADRLEHLRGADVVVLGLPRGGVPVAFEVARRLGAPLDVVVVRKLGVPFQPELALGAVGEDGALVLNEDVVRRAHVSAVELGETARRALAEVDRRAQRFRTGRSRLPLTGRTALVVDDGIATGATALAACRIVRAQGATRVVLAAPVCARDTATRLDREVDELVCLLAPRGFAAVGEYYADFDQTSDEEVVDLLARAGAATAAATRRPAGPGPVQEEVEIDAGSTRLAGHLAVPPGATGLVVFAHGSGSSRHSPRNRYVAGVLQESGLATLLCDLLTEHEEHRRTDVFDVELLAARLDRVSTWARGRPECAALPLGYFGASTGAAAALWAAAGRTDVDAVVSRGGRPDLAAGRLDAVRAPTLLVVGGDDRVVLELNRRAQARLRCETRLAVVPGAGHLFEEPGALDQVAVLARDWFLTHLAPVSTPRA